MNTSNFKIATLLIVSLLMTACGGSGNTASGGGAETNRASTASVILIGEWAGNISINGEVEYMMLDLRQTNSNQISGRLYSRAGGSHDYAVSGQLSGLSLRISADAENQISLALESDQTASFLTGSTNQSGSNSDASFERL